MGLASLLMFLSIPAGAWAGPTPEQTIAAIQAKAEAAEAWFDARADQYYSLLATNKPTATKALEDLNKAISNVNDKAATTELEITELMAKHPGNQDVQDAGTGAIANVWDAAASAIAAMTNAYDAYIAGTSTTTTLPPVTTTTLPTVTTTLPKVTTTTLPTVTTTLPKVTTTLPTTTTTAPEPTSTTFAGTSTTTTTIAPQAVPEPAPPTTTTTTTPELVAAVPPLPPEPPLSTAALASRLGAVAASTSAQPLTLSHTEEVTSEPASTVGSVLELVRISLPAAVVDPIVDLFIIFQAVAAAFVSGVLALAWPATVLLLILMIQATRRWMPHRPPATHHQAIADGSAG